VKGGMDTVVRPGVAPACLSTVKKKTDRVPRARESEREETKNMRDGRGEGESGLDVLYIIGRRRVTSWDLPFEELT
jgi:hypothetical protein